MSELSEYKYSKVFDYKNWGEKKSFSLEIWFYTVEVSISPVSLCSTLIFSAV